MKRDTLKKYLAARPLVVPVADVLVLAGLLVGSFLLPLPTLPVLVLFLAARTVDLLYPPKAPTPVSAADVVLPPPELLAPRPKPAAPADAGQDPADAPAEEENDVPVAMSAADVPLPPPELLAPVPKGSASARSAGIPDAASLPVPASDTITVTAPFAASSVTFAPTAIGPGNAAPGPAIPGSAAPGPSLKLQFLNGEFGVARLNPDGGIPPWALELLGSGQEALELRLGLAEAPDNYAGLPVGPEASRIRRKKEDSSRLCFLGRTASEQTLVGPWWFLETLRNAVDARRNAPALKGKKALELGGLSPEWSSLEGLQGPWKAFRVEGTLDFALTGILAALARPLAEAGISIYALSTWDTDYVLVASDKADAARVVLAAAGHVIS